MKPVYSNDRSAPRMKKSEFTTHVISKELWEDFKKESYEHRNIEWSDFQKIWGDIAETIRKESITNPLGVKLGSYTGELKLQWLPYKFNKHVNQALSEEMGDKVNHINLAERGKVARIKWERRWAVKFNRMLQFFAFTATRDMHKLSQNHINENSEKVRMSRNTLGGFSIWRELKQNNGK